MKIVEFTDVTSKNLSIGGIRVIFQNPAWKVFKCNSRNCNGVIIGNSGSCKYKWGNETFFVEKGRMIYLPYNSRHIVENITEDYTFYRIDFTLTDAADKETILFSDKPLPMKTLGDTQLECAKKLLKYYTSHNCIFEAQGALMELFADIKNYMVSGGRESRILPAIKYINTNYAEHISTKELADMCYMTETHLQRLFKSELGKTPTEYKNEIRIKTACILLSGGGYSIGEIAAMVGFESIYYFSRIFKRIVGIPPGRYIKGML